MQAESTREIPSIDAQAPTKTETAAFGMGCFWGVESLFGSVPGVVRTRVGYAGGTKEAPTYHSLGDHTETVEVVYDPDEVSYVALLELFWAHHTPTAQAYSQQYKNVAFTYTEAQRELALASRERQAEDHSREIKTEIQPITEFYPAEDYHQKYRLQNTDALMREYEDIYPDFDDFVASTAAARVNGYLGGHGTRAWLEAHLEELGLSNAGQQRLLERVGQNETPHLGEGYMVKKIEKSEEEWREELTEEEYRVMRQKGTERAFTGEYYNLDEEGVYRCAACGQPLFTSETKFHSGSGWPSFYKPASEENVEEQADTSLFMKRTEVVCSRCGAHLGHVFTDGPEPTGLRYCINSVSLDFEPGVDLEHVQSDESD